MNAALRLPILTVSLAASLVIGVFVPHVQAQVDGPASLAPGCFVSPARLSDIEIKAFLSAPQLLLDLHPTGGLALSSQVRSLIGSSASTLSPILLLVSGEISAGHLSAIASGIARAARACASTNPEYAARMQEEIVGLDNESFEVAFTAALGETQTAALGGGAGAGGGAAAAGGQAAGIGNGGTAGGGSGGFGAGSDPVAQGTTTFDGAGGSRFFSSGTGTTTILQVVSPN